MNDVGVYVRSEGEPALNIPPVEAEIEITFALTIHPEHPKLATAAIIIIWRSAVLLERSVICANHARQQRFENSASSPKSVSVLQGEISSPEQG